jgi:hypothetical protein
MPVRGKEPIMKRGFVGAAGALFLLGSGAAQGAEIKWVASLDAALTAAKAGNKLVMADFYTDW